jgi:hypothetical protein
MKKRLPELFLFLCRAGRLAAAVMLVGVLADVHAQGPSPAGQGTFEGSWSAVGRRRTIQTEGTRTAAIIEMSGAVVLIGGTGLSRGFRGEAIGFDDGRDVSAGSAVWTDAQGHHVFSALKSTEMQSGRRVTGAITGGTGPYAGITGEYSMTWQYVAYGEDDVVQGRTADLKGSFRMSGRQP